MSFNVLDATGCYLPFSEVWKEAHKCGITLRMGRLNVSLSVQLNRISVNI